jgi:PPM family protein phosphatase
MASLVVEACSGRGADRVAVHPTPNGLRLVVADGAGGVAGGAIAADWICKKLGRYDGDWERWFLHCSETVTYGIAAVVALDIQHDLIHGTSVGDCEAWLFPSERCLTTFQKRKPLLGERFSHSVGFQANLEGTLVVATDGLWKYASWSKVEECVTSCTLDALPAALVNLARLPNGKLQDDVAVVVVKS